MVEDIAGGDRGNTGRRRLRRKRRQPPGIAGTAPHPEAEIGAIAEDGAKLPERHLRGVVGGIGQQQADQPRIPGGDIVPAEPAAALPRPCLADAEQPAQAAPGGPVGRIEQKRRAIDEIDPGAGHKAHPRRLRGEMRADQSGDAVAVDDAKRRKAEPCCRREQFVGRGGAAQEAEMRRHLQFDIGRRVPGHAKAPCRNQPAGAAPSPSRNSQ